MYTLDEKKALIASMTLQEKASLVVGAGWGSMLEGLNLPFCSGHKVPGAAGETRAIERLGLPSMVLADGPAGIRMKNPGATLFPSANCLASTRDEKLASEFGYALGEEARTFGVNVLLAPGLNLIRNPLCGRNFEYFSEDVELSGDMAGSIVWRMQHLHVAATGKHYAMNNQETNRFHNNVIVDEKTMRSRYLENFLQMFYSEGPWALMASYNSVNGIPVQRNKHLLKDVLRDEFIYEGLVMSDWQRHKDPAGKIAAGVDLLMPGSKSEVRSICRAVRKGKLSEERLNEAVGNVLSIINLTTERNMFRGEVHCDFAAHAALSRRIAAAGCVLLKNENNALPLSPDAKKVGLMGIHSYNLICGGSGSGYVNCEHRVSLDEAFKARGFRLNGRAEETYRAVMANKRNLVKPKGLGFASKYMCEPVYKEFRFFSEDNVQNVVDLSDAIIVTIGRQAGEGVDVKLEKGGYYLSDAEMELLRSVSRRCQHDGKQLIVILNVAHVIETASWQDLADAILVVWLPGQEGGHAIVDVLTGEVKPSGKLPMTWPIRYEDLPNADNFPAFTKDRKPVKTDKGVKNVDYTEYAEGEDFGHYYFDKHPEIPVAYPFGFGLTY